MLAVFTAGVILVIGTAVAAGATGDLVYKDCITGETESGSAGSAACDAIASAATSAANSGLAGPDAIALSPDGANLYVVSLEDDAIARFTRNTANGKLAYKGCITGETQSGPAGSAACDLIPSATSSGTSSGMDFPVSIEVSPDGASVYVVAKSDDAIVRFKRDQSSGKLAYRDCITGETESGPTGSGACEAIPGAAAGGANAGLNDPQAGELSADGASLYIAGLGDEAVIRFNRNLTSGKLTYKDCLTGDTAASGACEAIPSATAGGVASGLSNPITVASSADGRSLYLGAQGDTALARFGRSTTSGKLSYKDCITGETESGATGSGACEAIASATSGGGGSGLESLQSATVSPDGSSVYLTASGDDAVARFARNTTSGGLTYRECVTGDGSLGDVCRKIPHHTLGGASSGLDTAGASAISSDGTSLYVSSPFDDAVTVFARDPATGRLTDQGCTTGEQATGPTGAGACAAVPSVTTNGTDSGLDNPQDIALSADDSSVYVGTSGDDSIARFSRAP